MEVHEIQSPHSRPPLPSPVGSRVRSEDAMPSSAPPAQPWSQVSATHSDPTSGRTAFRVGPLCTTSLPHRGYVGDSPGPTCTISRGLARAPQAASLASEDHQTRLRNLVRPASSQVQGHSVHLSVKQGCPCFAVQKSRSCWRKTR